MPKSQTFEQIIHSRRSVRKYDTETPFDHDAVTRALELTTLSPNSSNMQMWEFHRVINKEMREQLGEICMGQNAAKTASELIVVVVTQHNWKQRAIMNAEVVREAFKGREDDTSRRALKYYEKLIPFVYNNDPFGLFGLGRKLLCHWLGRKKPMVREVSKQDLRVCLHKSAALAAMTFMYAMRDQGYDTCPMEGFDSVRTKKLLGLRSSDQISMIISCGLRAENGIYSERHRVPNNEVIFTH